MGRVPSILFVSFAAKRSARRPSRPEVRIEPGIDFEATHVVYHVTVRNRGDVVLRDVVIKPRIVHGSFFLDEPPKAIPVLKPESFGTATFRIGAKSEPGELEVAARISYWDRESGGHHEAPAPPLRVDLRPPSTRPVYLTPVALRERASRSLSVQESISLSEDADRAFSLVAAALAQEGLEKVEEMTYVSGDSFVGQASFHGLDRRRNSYAVRVVVSRKGPATLKLHVFVQAEETLFGFYWRIRDAVHRALGMTVHHP